MATIGVTNSGKDYITGLIKQTNNTEPSYVAIGTGTTAFAATQTALVTEVETRTNGTTSQATTTTTNDTYRSVGTVTAGTARTVAEAGLFTASSAGTMVVRTEFSGATVALAIGDSIQLTFEIRLS